MNCKNCKNEIADNYNYCSKCGAKVIRERLTLKTLFAHFSEKFLNYDNTFLQTFIHLFTKPEIVIGSYINGTRKKYANVISYFAIAITITGLQLFILKKFFPESLEFSNLTNNGNQAFGQDLNNTVLEYNSLLMMLYIPIYALMSKIVFYNYKKYNYTEHLVMFLYIQGQLSILLAVISIILSALGANYMSLSFYLLPIMIIYSGYCLKRIFNLTFKQIILKTLLFIPVLIAFYILFSIIGTTIYLIYLIITGGFNEFIESFKPQKV